MKKKILIADDNPDVRFAIEDGLKTLGADYRFYKAKDGEECINIAKDKDVDLVILDIMMPKMDGWQTFFNMHFENIKKPVIFVTAKQEGYVKNWVNNMGAKILTKPFDMNELAKLVSDELK